METPSATSGRFDGLNEDELELTRFAYQQVAKRIMDRAAADDYEGCDLAGAAATFHLASTLAGEVGEHLGEETPSAETLDMAASCIALGQAPGAALLGAHGADPEALIAGEHKKARAALHARQIAEPDHAELVAGYESGPGSTTPEDR